VTWNIERVQGVDLDIVEVLEVYHSSGLARRRPVEDRQRFSAMVRNADLVLCCRLNGELVGIARSMSDFAYATYLSDLAVAGGQQRRGIGRALIDATRAEAAEAKIVLLASPTAAEYYPHLGFLQHGSAWVLNP
jgi:predicted N-acetyltransferase YhbS